MIEYIYIIDNDRVGFYYVPYAGSMPLHGIIECSVMELGAKVMTYPNRKACYDAICKDTYGE